MNANKQPAPTREQRRDAARAQAAKLREEQAAREKRTRNILLGVLAGIVVLAIGLAVVIWRVGEANADRSLLEDFTGAVPANADIRGGVTVGADGAAGAEQGNTGNLAVYLDFMCPYCGQFETANATDLDALRKSGDLTVTYHVVSNLDSLSQGTAFSTRAANAAATVASDAPTAYVAFLEGMFANQPEEQTTGLTDEQIASIALDAGVPQEVVDTFAAGTYNDWVAVASDQAVRDGAGGTPTVKLNGEKLPNTVNYYEQGTLGAWLAEQGIGTSAVGD